VPEDEDEPAGTGETTDGDATFTVAISGVPAEDQCLLDFRVYAAGSNPEAASLLASGQAAIPVADR
jgi:hypothetical protein